MTDGVAGVGAVALLRSSGSDTGFHVGDGLDVDRVTPHAHGHGHAGRVHWLLLLAVDGLLVLLVELVRDGLGHVDELDRVGVVLDHVGDRFTQFHDLHLIAAVSFHEGSAALEEALLAFVEALVAVGELAEEIVVDENDLRHQLPPVLMERHDYSLICLFFQGIIRFYEKRQGSCWVIRWRGLECVRGSFG